MQIDQSQTLLLLLESRRELIPLNPTALIRAQGSKRSLERDYRGALVISREGKVWPIERIEIIGPWGTSFFGKLTSRLNDAQSIVVHFGPEREMSLDEFKTLVIEYVGIDIAENGDAYLPQTEPLETLFDGIRSARTFAEVFGRIQVPAPEDALDVL